MGVKQIAALQDGLRAAGLQRAAMHQRHNYDGKMQWRKYQARDLVSIHDVTLGQEKGSKLLFPWAGLALITKYWTKGE